MDFVRIDQCDLAVRHLARPAFNLGGPEGIGVRVRIFGVQAGDRIVRQLRALRGGQVQRDESNLDRCHRLTVLVAAAAILRPPMVFADPA